MKVSDLIYRHEAIRTITSYNGTVDKSVAKRLLLQMLSAEPEQKRGHWVGIDDEPCDVFECDVCGFVIDGSGCIDPEEYRDVYKFCPNCGADMRGEQDDT